MLRELIEDLDRIESQLGEIKERSMIVDQRVREMPVLYSKKVEEECR